MHPLPSYGHVYVYHVPGRKFLLKIHISLLRTCQCPFIVRFLYGLLYRAIWKHNFGFQYNSIQFSHKTFSSKMEYGTRNNDGVGNAMETEIKSDFLSDMGARIDH